MTEEKKFLNLGNFNEKITYNQNNGKLEKKDFVGNNKLLQIFNFFDKDGNGIIETSNSNGVNEMASLWNTVKTSANKNGNSIFEEAEAQELLASSMDYSGKSLAESKVTVSELFDFLKVLINLPKKQTMQNTPANEFTPEEVQELSVTFISDDIKAAKELYNAQLQGEGKVSKFVNNTKENFDTEYAASRVNRYLMNEELCLKLLEKAQNGELTEKEYLEAKLDLAVALLPQIKNSEIKANITKAIITLGLYDNFGGMTKSEQERIIAEAEVEFLKEALGKLTPEELTNFITQVVSLSDSEYQEHAPAFVENLINQTIEEKLLAQQTMMNDSNKIIMPHIAPNKNSVSELILNQATYKTLNFEDVFNLERGVTYNEEAIMDYTSKNGYLQFLVGLNNRNEEIRSTLSHLIGINEAVESTGTSIGAPELEASLNDIFKNLYGNNTSKIKEIIALALGEDANVKIILDENGKFEKLEYPTLYASDKVKIANSLLASLEENYQTALKGRTIEDYSEEVQAAYQQAFGIKNSKTISEMFVQSQQEGVQKTKAYVQGAGMVVMVAGQLIPVAGQTAAGLLVTTGILTSTVGGTAVSAIENFSKAGGATEEDKIAMLKELSTSVALMASGIGIGKGSEAVFRNLVMKNCPKLLAYAAEVGVDTTMSLLADYAITGQIDLSGEGIAQIQNIIVGILTAKGNFNTYIDTHAGNLNAKTKKTELTQKFGLEDINSIKMNDVDLNNSVTIKSNIEELKQKSISLKRSCLTFIDGQDASNKYGINSYEDLINFELITKEEKMMIQRIYANAEKHGYKEFLDSNIDVLIGFASAHKNIDGKLVSLYENLGPESLAVIKDAKEQFNQGTIEDKYLQAIQDRIAMSTPIEIYRYVDCPEKLPDRVYSDRFEGLYWEKETCLKEIENIKLIQEFINTQSVPNDMIVYRVQGYNVMKNVKIGDSNLADIMQDAVKNGNVDEVVKMLNNSDIIVHNDNHLGTSLTPHSIFSNNHPIKWEISVPEGSKGVFLESAIPEGAIYSEVEFLIQMGSGFKIKEVEYKDGVWNIKADLVQDGANLTSSYINSVKTKIPNLTEAELRFLEEQMERVSRGEDRWLGTEEEFDILENIFKKYADAKGRDKDYAWRAENFERTRIPFEKQEITDLEKILLNGWYKYGMGLLGNPDNQADFANLFDRLGTVLEEDVSLYRCITLRADGGVNLDQVKFLNTVKEGAIIDNTGRYTSTASHPNGALNYGTTFGQSYTLKINVPAGTKILDMTHCKDYMIDEYILPKDANYRVIKIDYETGIVECELILPNEN